ncbi:MAG: TetR family transcriptional regulator [Bdellovibrionota bacterium]
MPQKKARAKTSAVKKAGRPNKAPESTLNENDAKQRLIESATELFGEKGLDGVSTREIAQHCGLNISLISYYFGGKLGLYKGVLRAHMTKFTAAVSDVVTRGEKVKMTHQTLRESMTAILDNFLRMGESERHIFAIMTREKSMGMPHAASVHDEIVTPIAGKLIGMLAEAQRQGIVRTDINPHTFFILFFESVFGFVTMSKCNLKLRKQAHQLPSQKEAFKNAVLDIFLKGITK